MQYDEYARMRELEDSHWWFISRRRLLVRALRRFTLSRPRTQPLRLVDVGCGTGGTLDFLQPFGEVTGVDMEVAALQFCRDRGYPNLALADATALPFADGSYDAVVALDVLEHIPDHAGAAREIARILAPEGLVYITVPAYRSLWSSHDVALMHQRRYVAREVKTLLHGAGLEPVHLTYAMTAYFPLVWAIRTARNRLAPNAPPRADVAPTPAPLNWALRAWLDVESVVAVRTHLPFGLTVFAIARRK